jgi:hypothetical protein
MAQRVLTERPDDARRLEYAFRLCVARPPQSAERERFQSLLNTARRYYEEQPKAAKKLTAQHRAENVPVAESAAWTVVCRTMLNMDEFITRE